MEDVFMMSRLVRLDVKWTGLHQANIPFHHWGHSNPYYELIMVIDGPVYLQVEDERLVLQSGECLLLTPWQHHKGWRTAEPNTSFYWAQFTADPALIHSEAAGSLKQSLRLFRRHHQDLRTAEGADEEPLLVLRRYLPERRFDILLLFEKLVAEMKQPNGNFRFRSTIWMMQIMQALSDSLLKRQQWDTPLPATYITYRELVNYLNEHYTQTITRQMLEHRFRRKYEYLCQLFNKYSSSTFTKYLQQLRIQRAQYLLRRHPEATIETVAQQVGFQDPFYFSKVFKQIAGTSPSQFRTGVESEQGREKAD
ncbi:HTH-type transcriptional activator RhaR [Paenibacillus solanacearum]|uniref:HTH-type transcriptional activator RhaR n=1 Tax=Paenibacillus solanacearum TaxID=2048548 RepID=A0A916NKN6_9BACL|nr:AraC family transcriptional regulator [Paenibacillus solanacearum]CAG7643782.1 HTH-type transcriptional activator RhaR [Paenibacillus solanacearum]